MPSETGVELPKKRGRPAGMKSLPKHPPRPISEIWRAATPEERETARRAAEELLAYWRGLTGSKSVAGVLGLRQNRVYLLQRKALAGMVAGLLPARPKREEGGAAPTKEAGDLRKEVVRLRREREALVGLVRLLRSMPSKEGKGGAKNAGAVRGAGSSGSASAGGSKASGAKGDGGRARRVGADATRVGKEG